MTPLISFIITYHNEPEHYLRSCLQSIESLRLSPDEAEIIVVDDGSEAFEIEASGFTVIRQAPQGLSVARNTGIDAARGRYIQFIDADDCLIPEQYGMVLNEVRREEADIIMFSATTGKAIPETRLDSPHLWKGSGRLYLLRRNLRAAAWGYAFRRDILGNLRFQPGLLHEDELFTPLLFLKAEALVELQAKAYYYRQHQGTITSSRSKEKVQKRLNDIHLILCELKDKSDATLERRLRQLTVDYLQKTLTLTHSLRELLRRRNELRKDGLLPLPVRTYSLRYFLASMIF